MSAKRWPSRAHMSRCARRRGRGLFPFLVLLLPISMLAAGVLYFRTLSTDLAVSMAQDAVVAAVGEIVKDEIVNTTETHGSLTTLEKNAAGEVSAVTTNVAALNALAGDILLAVTNATAEHNIEISIPIGSLTGSSLLLSRGPRIRIQVQVLGSTFTGFQTDITSIGINQTRHRIVLELCENITLLMPWHTVETSVVTEIPVAETIIVGKVPESYLNIGE